MKIIIDMNLSPLWVTYFLENGVEAQHWSSVGNPNDPDVVILDWANQNQAIVFTNDLDFGAILAASQAKSPSVFQVRTQDLLPQVIGEIVLENLRKFASELESGVLISLDLNRAKIRILCHQNCFK